MSEEMVMSDQAFWTLSIQLGHCCVTDLRGFTVEGRDGRIGTLKTGCAYPGRSYLIVSTYPSLGIATTMLPAGLVEHIDEDRATVLVGCCRSDIVDAPPLEVAYPHDGAYRAALERHYARTQSRATPTTFSAPRSLVRSRPTPELQHGPHTGDCHDRARTEHC